MSDTPETDVVWTLIESAIEEESDGKKIWILVRKNIEKLERERDEARKERDDLKTRLVLMDDFKSEILQGYATAIGCAGHESPVRKAELLVKERDELRAEIDRANKDNESLAGRLTACELERDFLGSEMERMKDALNRIGFYFAGTDEQMIADLVLKVLAGQSIQAAMKGAE